MSHHSLLFIRELQCQQPHGNCKLRPATKWLPHGSCW